MSEASSKRVTFERKGEPIKKKNDPPRKPSSLKSTATRSDGDSVMVSAASSKNCNPPKLSSLTGHRKAKKTLVRNCDRPVENARITKPTGSSEQSNEFNNRHSTRVLSSLPVDRLPQTIPTMNSNLDTARRMKAISEMTLQTAASKNKDFEICQEDIIQKVSKIAVNVPATERIFNNLVSVDVSESSLRPRKLNNQVKPREKADPVPNLADFTQNSASDAKIWPKFPPISISFQPIDTSDAKSVLLSKKSLRDKSEMLLEFK